MQAHQHAMPTLLCACSQQQKIKGAHAVGAVYAPWLTTANRVAHPACPAHLPPPSTACLVPLMYDTISCSTVQYGAATVQYSMVQCNATPRDQHCSGVLCMKRCVHRTRGMQPSNAGAGSLLVLVLCTTTPQPSRLSPLHPCTANLPGQAMAPARPAPH